MVLTSILIGLGIAELLNGMIRILRSNFREGIYLPQIIWAFFLLQYLVIIWWSRWDLHITFEWNFLQLMLSLVGPIVIFIMAGLVLPLELPAREHYFRQQKVIFTLMPLAAVISIVHELVIEGTAVISLTMLYAISLFTVTLIPRFAKKDWIHLICSGSGVALFFGFVIANSFSISSSPELVP
jgi:hypothetical protein